MFCFGAVGGAFTGKEDIFYVMIAQGLTIPALIVLGANIWTTNDNALYTGGLGLSNVTGMRKRPTGAHRRRGRYGHGDLAVQELCGLAQLPQLPPCPPSASL